MGDSATSHANCETVRGVHTLRLVMGESRGTVYGWHRILPGPVEGSTAIALDDAEGTIMSSIEAAFRYGLTLVMELSHRSNGEWVELCPEITGSISPTIVPVLRGARDPRT